VEVNAHGRDPARANDSARGPQVLVRHAWLAIRTCVLMGALFAVFYYPYAPGSGPARLIDGLLALQGRSAAALLAVFDPDVQYVEGTILGRFPLRVVKACGAFDAHALYAGAVLAYAARWYTKLMAIAAGAAALLVVNSLRMAALAWVGAYAPQLFDVVHEELFPLLLVGVALAGFALFTVRVGRDVAGPVHRAP
jgi:exosortase/archaeosortase family protein